MAGAIQNGCTSTSSTNTCNSLESTRTYPKRLAAFDFDQTIVNGNTDTVVRALINPSNIPTEVQNLVNTICWTSYMQEIFILLHKFNINENRIKKCIREMNEVPGMIRLLKKLHNMNFDLIVISDSNTVFINEWCTAHALTIFSKVYTNPAEFQDDGLLKIKPYEYQTECKLSAENLCKGNILQNFITEKFEKDNIKYNNVIYIGDGTNDICPILRLSKCDYGCVRTNFSMDKHLTQNKNLQEALKVKKIIKWSSGFELLAELLNIFE